MKLDFSSLEKAVASLEVAIVRTKVAVGDPELRDAVIQRFEYTYELCWKMLKRQLEVEAPTPAEVDGYSFAELIRQGVEKGIINDFKKWLTYRDQRNITSHTYDQEKAKAVYQTSLLFLGDAKKLLAELTKRHADSH